MAITFTYEDLKVLAEALSQYVENAVETDAGEPESRDTIIARDLLETVDAATISLLQAEA